MIFTFLQRQTQSSYQGFCFAVWSCCSSISCVESVGFFGTVACNNSPRMHSEGGEDKQDGALMSRLTACKHIQLSDGNQEHADAQSVRTAPRVNLSLTQVSTEAAPLRTNLLIFMYKLHLTVQTCFLPIRGPLCSLARPFSTKTRISFTLRGFHHRTHTVHNTLRQGEARGGHTKRTFLNADVTASVWPENSAQEKSVCLKFTSVQILSISQDAYHKFPEAALTFEDAQVRNRKDVKMKL